MKTTGLNLRHLYFFWVVTKEGGVTRAAERLGLAVQTISSQLAQLEQSVGKSLLAPQGRRLVDRGGAAGARLRRPDFPARRTVAGGAARSDAGKMRLTVGISDSLPKLIAYRLLEVTRCLYKSGQAGLLRG